MESLIEFRNVLVNANELPWENSIFLPKDKNWSLNSLCYLFNLDDLDDNEEVPQFAIDNNLDYVLSMADIQDIVDNAYQQQPECSEIDLFKAFMYYYENDAFITLSK
ncbi:hypothetical protein [Clostridium sp. DJ247]|uniref:DUF7716 domain-containing protein n=1 Tax=Clostridium sp. DJ247 TaxID=2726188 RepID=UPI0016243FF0|nr:hypothetical protein [Clostridium sp. DJ247]MBC2582959.1 hypothetical protein [Clostridium sp. DJ247]